MQNLILIKGPHLLFAKTAGIVVRRTEPETQIEARGYLRKFEVNLHCLVKRRKELQDRLGITSNMYNEMLGECLLLEKESE